MTFFLSLLYQEEELYMDGYVSRSDAVFFLRVLAALAGILFVVYLWWLRRRRRSRARSEYMTDAWGRVVEVRGSKLTVMHVYVIFLGAVLAMLYLYH